MSLHCHWDSFFARDFRSFLPNLNAPSSIGNRTQVYFRRLLTILKRLAPNLNRARGAMDSALGFGPI